MIYFDNGATSFPKPMRVKKAAESFFHKYGGNPGRSGHNISVETAGQVFTVREKLKNMFNAKSEEDVIFTLNCTDAENMVINGLLKKGDHVIISDMEHNSVARPIYRLAKQGIITFDIADTYGVDEATVRSIESLIRPNTRLIITVHASNVLGTVLPIRKIGEMCRRRGILYMVDGAQTGGVMPIDMERDKIDFLCLAGHKGLYSASGVGVLITDKGELLRPTRVGGSGSLSYSLDSPDFMPDRLECGTPNTLGIITLGAGIDYVNEVGMDRIYEKEMKMAKYLHDELSKIKNIIIYSTYPEPGKAVPVVAFNIMGNPSEKTCGILNERGFCLRGGYHCSPLAHKKAGTMETGMARASFGSFNNMGEISNMVKILKN